MIFKNSKNYDNLKFTTQIVLPAFGTLYFTLAKVWGLPYATEVVGTISAVTVFCGTVLQISNKEFEQLKAEMTSNEKSLK